ncbi:hypothetical protein [Cardinium endosymbiont of Culicoides punctatus]|uniref:hypothetical protein n=1 Tax=Cardinium endosymbiont of Culicoides punctatus TaxID=2304601 RepID=UPI0010587D2F|nr:hypothetical protein [Cardinium endosymbiont of Culicoides punctatus]TDG95521.1 hypothetical protein CCPUN_02570 [Cardinium endosymbiont of Culicoides punctatus]
MKYKIYIYSFILFFLFLVDVRSQQEISWIDLPEENLEEILYSYDTSLEKVNRLIQYYHSLPKESEKFILKRIKLLEVINLELLKVEDNMSDEKIKEILKVLSDICSKKKNYLKELMFLKTQGIDHLKKKILTPPELSCIYTPLVLNNKKKFDHKTLEIWGEFFLEAVDPCHRRLMTYFKVWKKENPNNEIPDFFIWLENKNVSRFYPTIELISKSELNKYEIFIKDNKLYHANGSRVHQPNLDKELIFIITCNLRIFACIASSKIRHTSLSHYKPILGSGSLWVKDGEVIQLSLNSGHYIPQLEHYLQTLNIFKEKSLHLNDDINLIYYKDYKESYTTLGKFKLDFFNE